jgi:DsbC/DsbD-like thiol-disulfide interchange protein
VKAFETLCAALLSVAMAIPVASSQIPSGRDVVSPAAYVSMEPAARGSDFQIAVVLTIRDGFHINARQTSASYLIPTDVKAELPTGFKLDEVAYPKGELHTFPFSKQPLNVYQGKTVVRVPVTVLTDAPLGAQHIPLKLHYQACNNEVCLPPATLNLDATVTIVATASESRPSHGEIFRSNE